MKLVVKARPEDFVVREELCREPGREGGFAVYRATKRLLTTIELQERLARQLGAPPRALVFPALKDKAALATQHFSVSGCWPSKVEGEGYTAEFIGRLPRHLRPSDLAGNRFEIRLRRLSEAQADTLAARLDALAREGLPNYFDEQRFGSYAVGGVFFGKLVLRRDAEGALRAYMTQRAPGDPAPIRGFKALAAERWGDWPLLFEQAPRSNYRSILSFLKDHPADFRRALDLVTPRLLPLLLAAYQSFLWNRIASRVLESRLARSPGRVLSLEIAGDPLVAYSELPAAVVDELRSLAISLPHHQAAFAPAAVRQAAEDVLAAERLTLRDLKARLLTRAYLPRGNRRLVVFPQQAEARVEPDRAGGACTLCLAFFLPPGTYATLVIKALAAGWRAGAP